MNSTTIDTMLDRTSSKGVSRIISRLILCTNCSCCSVRSSRFSSSLDLDTPYYPKLFMERTSCFLPWAGGRNPPRPSGADPLVGGRPPVALGSSLAPSSSPDRREGPPPGPPIPRRTCVLRCSTQRLLLLEIRHFHVLGKTQKLQRPDGAPGDVQLIPSQTVTRRRWMRMMVIVPALAERYQRNPPVVLRVVARRESFPSPQVRRRIHQPGGMQAQGHAKEDAPEQERQSAKCEQQDTQNRERHPMPLRQPHQEPVLRQIRSILGAHRRVAMRHVAHQHPDNVRPPLTVAWRVRIAIFVRELMMDAVRGHPEHRAAFQRRRPADGQKIFDRLRHLVAAVRQQPVIAHPDPQAHRHPVKNQSGYECGPAKKEKGANRAQMENGESDTSNPIDPVPLNQRCGSVRRVLHSFHHEGSI